MLSAVHTSPKNSSLVDRAQKGEASAIGELYQQHQPVVYRYLFYRVGDLQTAEDLTSEVFVRMLHHLPGYQTQKVSFQAWLFQIARNLVIDHYRKMSLRKDAGLEENLIAATDDPAAAVEHGLTSENLHQALGRLSEEQRDVIVMRFIAGMPISVVAQALHKSEDSIKGLQRRALVTLRDILADWEVAYV